MYGPQSLKLLSGIAVDANGDGAWFYIGNMPPTYSIIATGLESGDKIQVWVSNNASDAAPTAYTAAQGAVKLGDDVTGDSMIAASEVHSWISIRKTAFAGGGAIVVRLAGLVA